MAHSLADNEELLGHVVDSQAEVSQSELLHLLEFLISAPSTIPRKADVGRGHGRQARAHPQRGEESQ